jgi:O-antigen/teichoic acid export membrane protein
MSLKRALDTTFVITASNILEKIIGMILTLWIARYLGVEGFGFYSFILSFPIFLIFFCDIGINSALFRKIVQDPSKINSFLSKAVSAKTVLLIFCTIASLALFMIFPLQTAFFMWLICMGLFIYSIAGTFNTVFYSVDSLKNIFWASLTYKTTFFLLTLIAIFFDTNITGLVFANFASSIIFFIFNFFTAKKFFGKLNLNFSIEKIISTIKESVPLSVNSFLAGIYARIDTIILYYLVGNISTGIYSAAVRLTESLSFLSVSLSSSAYVFMNRLFKDGEEKRKKIFFHSLKLTIALYIPMTIGITILSDKIITFFYGAEFLEAGYVLMILAWFFLLSSVNQLMAFQLKTFFLEKRITIFRVTTLSINIALNFALIPLLFATGAAIALLVSEIIYFAMLSIECKKNLKKLGFFHALKKPVTISIAMAIFLFAFPSLNILILIPLATIIYFTIYAVTGLDNFEKSILKIIANEFMKKVPWIKLF